MAELKTRQTGASVKTFIAGIEDPEQRKDSAELVKLLRQVTGATPRMWGPAIVGFGDHTYRSTGGETAWFRLGFSPRKGQLSIYMMSGVEPLRPLLAKLGRHTTGKGCLYLKRLSDVDRAVLERVLTKAEKAILAKSG